MSKKKPKEQPLAYLVMQQGGATREWYAEIHDTEAEAWMAIQAHQNATYNAVGPYPIPADLTQEQWACLSDTLEELCSHVVVEDFPEVPVEHQHDEDEIPT